MWFRETSPQNRKMTPPVIKDKKVTYSNLSLKLWNKRQCAIDLISVKSYKKGLIFPVVKTVKDSQMIH